MHFWNNSKRQSYHVLVYTVLRDFKIDKQQSTKHAHKTNDRVTRTPLKSEGELMCSGRVRRYCSTSGIRCVNQVTSLVISHSGIIQADSLIMFLYTQFYEISKYTNKTE
jgi:hypothetical protein